MTDILFNPDPPCWFVAEPDMASLPSASQAAIEANPAQVFFSIPSALMADPKVAAELAATMMLVRAEAEQLALKQALRDQTIMLHALRRRKHMAGTYDFPPLPPYFTKVLHHLPRSVVLTGGPRRGRPVSFPTVNPSKPSKADRLNAFIARNKLDGIPLPEAKRMFAEYESSIEADKAAGGAKGDAAARREQALWREALPNTSEEGDSN